MARSWSRSADVLRLPTWDNRDGRLFLGSTISSVVDNDSYLMTSNANRDF